MMPHPDPRHLAACNAALWSANLLLRSALWGALLDLREMAVRLDPVAAAAVDAEAAEVIEFVRGL